MKILTIPKSKTAGWLMLAALPVFVAVCAACVVYCLTYDWLKGAFKRISGEEK